MTEQVNIADLPSVSLAERERLPDCAAIYFAVAASGEVLYVGRALSVNQRWRAHHRLHQLENLEGVSIAWLAVSDPELLPEIEFALIKHFQPRLNWSRAVPLEEMVTVAFRIPQWALTYYQDVAEKERRKLGQVLRIVLEDHAKSRRRREQAA